MLWKLISTYRGEKAITSSSQSLGGWSPKPRNVLQVQGFSAVCIREIMVWVGLNAEGYSKSKWVWSDLTHLADRHSEILYLGSVSGAQDLKSGQNLTVVKCAHKTALRVVKGGCPHTRSHLHMCLLYSSYNSASCTIYSHPAQPA
jgi:hypothetical protein